MTVQPDWIGSLSEFSTVEELRRSPFFLSAHDRIQTFLETPQIHIHDAPAPRLSSFLRVAHWNIEKGKCFDAILDCFTNGEILKWADVILLNEADYGMNRSRNRHVARDLAERLGMHMVFAPAHFELTKGTGDELDLDGDNGESLQGNAVLSRFPVLDASILPLPVTFEPFEFEEKRYGNRCCLWVKLRLRRSVLWIGSTHLELRNTPRCRARQMRHLLANFPGDGDAPCLLGGDLNTNSFGRGTVLRTLRSVLRLLAHSPSSVKDELLHPERGKEPLFEVARGYGFRWEGLNSGGETARTPIDTLEESQRLPDFAVRGIGKRLEPYDGNLCFKLDWFLGRCLESLKNGQVKDARAGIASRDPGCVEEKHSGPDRISDHRPIYVDLDLT